MVTKCTVTLKTWKIAWLIVEEHEWFEQALLFLGGVNHSTLYGSANQANYSILHKSVFGL